MEHPWSLIAWGLRSCITLKICLMKRATHPQPRPGNQQAIQLLKSFGGSIMLSVMQKAGRPVTPRLDQENTRTEWSLLRPLSNLYHFIPKPCTVACHEQRNSRKVSVMQRAGLAFGHTTPTLVGAIESKPWVDTVSMGRYSERANTHSRYPDQGLFVGPFSHVFQTR